MSVVLAIDTAADRLQLALRRADGRIDTLVEPMKQGHAEALFPAIAALLGRNGLAYADLGRIAVTTGPGSFTGLRVGLSAARGLGLALGIPVLGIPTMSAVSLLAPPKTSVAVLLDVRRGEMYRQEFFGPMGELHDRETRPRPAAEAFDNIGQPKKWSFFVRFDHVLGSGAAQAAAATGATNLELLRPEADRGFVDIGLLAEFVVNADPALWPPEPLYARPADARPQDGARVARQSAGATP
jgi:tRNA threonylcarbamoyladenosine biosynthesis protein TsaB